MLITGLLAYTSTWVGLRAKDVLRNSTPLVPSMIGRAYRGLMGSRTTVVRSCASHVAASDVDGRDGLRRTLENAGLLEFSV